MSDKADFIKICDLTTNLCGLEIGSLSLKSRKQNLIIPRMVASCVARIELNISHNTIAEVLNKHRTSVYHYEKCHKGNYTWSRYRDVFNKVYMAFKDIDDKKKIFLDEDHFKSFLLKGGVKQNNKQEVMIMVTSGDVKAIICTSYMDFSNQLENIKIALRDYRYTFKIL
tara:strand:- start:8148 stop:8654 length:507 start_codon:yes stop_codon:yes gene_type:complete